MMSVEEIKFKMREDISSLDILKISNWLYADYKKTGSGFWSNIKWLWNNYTDGDVPEFFAPLMIVGYVDGEPVGYILYKEHLPGEVVDIQIMCMRRGFRGKGYGTKLLQIFKKAVAHSDFKTIRLECSPIESEIFWRKQSFINADPSKKQYGEFGNVVLHCFLKKQFGIKQ